MNETRIRKGTIINRTTALALLGLACLMAVPNIAHARYRDGMNLYQYVQSGPVQHVDPMGLTPWTSQRTSKSVVQIVKGQDFLPESYEYNFATENDKAAFRRDLGEAVKKYQRVLGVSADGCWGRGAEQAHLKKVGEHVRSCILTFDDGPAPVAALNSILNELGKHEIKGVFFVLGSEVKANPGAAKSIVEKGHVIGNHSWDHPNLAKLSYEKIKDQLKRTQDIIKEATGVTPTRLRPPYGAGWVGGHDAELIKASNELGLILTGWWIDTNDWKAPKGIKFDSVDKQLKNYIKGGHYTKIDLLMHIQGATAKDLPELIERLKAYEFSFTTY